MQARIPSIPVHADHIEHDSVRLAALILPNIGALPDAQCATIRGFCEFGLADVLGVDGTGAHHGRSGAADPSWETWAQHTYRLDEGVVGRGARLLVADQEAKLSVDDGWAAFELGSILDHEVVVVT